MTSPSPQPLTEDEPIPFTDDELSRIDKLCEGGWTPAGLDQARLWVTLTRHREVNQVLEQAAVLAVQTKDEVVAELSRLRAENTAQAARLEEQRGATRVAAGAADRFRDVLSEALGHPDENPGDDVLVAEVREHFGFSGPEPTRWRDFLTGARAKIDQIEADHAAPGLDQDGSAEA